MLSRHEVEARVLETVAGFAAADPAYIAERRMTELFSDSCDFIELSEDLERTYRINLRPFFEDGQPEVGWWIWRRKMARDATARELARHIATLVAGAE